MSEFSDYPKIVKFGANRKCNGLKHAYLVVALSCVRNLNDDSVACAGFTTWTRSVVNNSKFGNRRTYRFPSY